MNIKLTGSAGTGEQILENWEISHYQLDEDEYKYNCELGCANKVPFNIRFGGQEGYMVSVLKTKEFPNQRLLIVVLIDH